MRVTQNRPVLFILACLIAGVARAQTPVPTPTPTTDGYRGIWYMNQPQPDRFKYKYSGGFATYPQQHVPMAIYAPAVNKTFFVYGGKTGDENRISNMVSYYDHATGTVPRPTLLISRDTNDTHYNPTLSIDSQGYLYVFCNSHGAGGTGGAKASARDLAKSFIFRSTKPYSIDSFDKVYASNFSYSQAWAVEGHGILWLHTRYDGNHRRLFFSTTENGTDWAKPSPLARMASGSYQISWANKDLAATALDHHPEKGGLNARTNIYYLQTRDFGKTWTTASGQKIDLPLTDTNNPSRIRDFEKEGLLVYLKDLTFDAEGHPIILYLTSKSYKSGPAAGPRQWQTARWTGTEWLFRNAFTSDHNYDHGSLYIEPDGLWRIIAPTDPGPQPGTTGGRIVVHISHDQGKTWQATQTFPLDNGRNQTYVRRPWHASDNFYAFWADGNTLEPSESDLYFSTKANQVFRLPRKMTGQTAKPEPVNP